MSPGFPFVLALVFLTHVSFGSNSSSKSNKVSFKIHDKSLVHNNISSITIIGEAPWFIGERRGFTIRAMVLRRGFKSRLHPKTRLKKMDHLMAENITKTKQTTKWGKSRQKKIIIILRFFNSSILYLNVTIQN